MARKIRFDAKAEAVKVLEGPLQRRNWTVDTRDVLADALERVVIKAFADAGQAVYNESED